MFLPSLHTIQQPHLPKYLASIFRWIFLRVGDALGTRVLRRKTSKYFTSCLEEILVLVRWTILSTVLPVVIQSVNNLKYLSILETVFLEKEKVLEQVLHLYLIFLFRVVPQITVLFEPQFTHFL
ncbi:MAG TPA: hypothetical protein PKK54_01090 [bacterium]|nr:hypothetical protein [bacterium]